VITAMAVVAFDPQLLEAIKTHSRREKEKGGYEAVGFLARPKGEEKVVASLPLANHCADPQQGFFVEPWEQFRAETKLAESGYEIVGVYHSHPTSEALPSRADRAMARPTELMVIYSVSYDDLKCWREKDGELEPVEIQ